MIRSPLFKVSWRAQNLEMCVMTLTPHLPVKIWQKEHFWNTVHCSLSNSYHQNTHKNHVQFIAVSTVQIRSIHCCIAFSSLFMGRCNTKNIIPTYQNNLRPYGVEISFEILPWKPRKVNKLADHNVHKFAINQAVAFLPLSACLLLDSKNAVSSSRFCSLNCMSKLRWTHHRIGDAMHVETEFFSHFSILTEASNANIFFADGDLGKSHILLVLLCFINCNQAKNIYSTTRS